MPLITCDHISGFDWQKPGDYFLSNTVDIWRIQVSGITNFSPLTGLLNPHEITRSTSYHHEKDQNRFILSRASLRILMAKYTNIDPHMVEFGYDHNKKPLLIVNNGTAIHYNTTHSGDWILIAVSNAPVGIDIEYINENFVYEDVMPACFSEAEVNVIDDAPDPRSCFYGLWTKKEALVKATGKGVDNELEYVPCIEENHSVLEKHIGSAKDWIVSSFLPADEYVAAIARDPSVQNIMFYEGNDLFTE